MLLLALPCLAQPQTYRIPFRDSNGLILLDLKVNGNASVMVLDTGALITLFKKAAIDTGALVIEVEPNHLVTVDALNLNDSAFRNVRATADKEAGRIDGILGENFLRRFHAVRIDYKNHVVELEAN